MSVECLLHLADALTLILFSVLAEACAMTTVPATRTVDAHAQRAFRSH
jgi:hypothetical protein